MSKDLKAGRATAKQVLELATWLSSTPGWVKAPDHFYESLDELAMLAADQLGLTIPEDSEVKTDLIDVVCSWSKHNY